MPLLDHLPAGGVIIGLPATSKKQVIEDISDHASLMLGLRGRSVFEALMQRERLGSTGIGGGIAIPHAVFSELTKSLVTVTVLDKAIEFGAHDRNPVDIILTIIGSDQAERGHSKLVSTASKQLTDNALCTVLRCAKSTEDIKSCLDTHQATAA